MIQLRMNHNQAPKLSTMVANIVNLLTSPLKPLGKWVSMLSKHVGNVSGYNLGSSSIIIYVSVKFKLH